jgi:cytochrome c biogenesis protein CcmG/thiol:disulfide interchange protein DsbE
MSEQHMVPVNELKTPDSHKNARRLAYVLLPAVGFVGLLAYGLIQSAPRAETGAMAPEFTLPTLDGGNKVSSKALKGQPVVLNFWASWCLPCREEAPLLEKAWDQYRKEGVILVGVNIKDSLSGAKRFVEQFGITYPIVRDENLQLSNELGVYGLPETFFIDHEWRLLATVAGESEEDQRQTVVLGAISEEQLRSNIEILIRRAATEKQTT